jgi:DNA modification methylase
MEFIKTEILAGDCLQLLKDYPNNFFNLIVTFPPYADRRNKTYGGIKPDKYVELKSLNL